MKKDKSEKINRIILIGILFVQVIFMIFYCDMKKGFFVDEVWSYGLANSYYHAQIWEDGALDNAEISPKMFKDYLTVNKGEEFKLGSVIYNQTHDSHPPLFYLVLHLISSFFPGEFSKWFGLIPNLFYYVITIIFLYKIGRLVVKDKCFAYFPILLYGFSIAAVNTVTYIRMYMLLTMWCIIFLYEHLKIVERKYINSIDAIGILIATFGGLFTHYYFAIFAAGVVIFQMFWMIMRKDWKMIGKYVLAGGIGGGCAIGVYPMIISNLTGNGVSHSQGTYQKMHDFSDWYSRIQQFWKIVSNEMFGSILKLLIIVLTISGIAYMITHVLWEMKLAYNHERYEIVVEKKNNNRSIFIEIKREYYLIVDIIVSCSFPFAIASKISPFQVNRYIMNLFPLFALLFCMLLFYIYTFWLKDKLKKVFAIIVSILIVGGLTYYANDPCYLYPEGENNIVISKKYEDLSCVYVYGLSYVMLNEALELQNYSRLYQMNYKDIDKYAPQVVTSNSKLVVYIDNVLDREYDETGEKVTMHTEECLNKIKKITGLSKTKRLYQDEKAYVFELYK